MYLLVLTNSFGVMGASWERGCSCHTMYCARNPPQTTESKNSTQESNHGDGNTQADEYISNITQCSS